MTILLTGTRAPATLDLARRLAAEGHHVVGADSMRFPLGKFSTAFASHHQLPSSRWEPDAFRSKLINLIRAEGITHVLPTCEEVFHIARYRETLAELTHCLFPALPVLETLHHKAKFVQLLGDLHTSVQAPESWDAHVAPKGIQLVWKPNYSRFAGKTRFFSPPHDPIGWLAQRFIAGEEFCTWAWCVDGIVRLQTAYKAAARAGRGAACSFTPYHSARASTFVSELARQLNYTGFLAFDFIETASGGIFVLECNPRLTSGIHLVAHEARFFMKSPMQMPSQAAQLFLPTLFCRPSVAGHSPDVVWSIDDPMPALGQFLTTAEFVFTSLRYRVGLLEATTHDIEYNGDA